jgi:hypothetical protein
VVAGTREGEGGVLPQRMPKEQYLYLHACPPHEMFDSVRAGWEIVVGRLAKFEEPDRNIFVTSFVPSGMSQRYTGSDMYFSEHYSHDMALGASERRQ